MSQLDLAAVALAALAAAWAAVAVTIRVASHAGWYDRRHAGREGGPGFRALPRVGGIGIVVAVVMVAVLAVAPAGELAVLGALALAVGAVGVVDDVRSLHGSTKLIVLIIAGSLAWLAGLRLEHIPGTAIPLPLPVAAAVTVAWMTVVPTAVNIVDGLDGLASGLAVIAAAPLAVAAIALGDGAAASLAVIALAATAGFWIHNRHPARVFMGDGGAMFLGFVLAALGLRVLAAAHTAAPAALVLAGLAWPLGELATTVVRRFGGSLTRADARHMHHVLHARLGHSAAVRTIHLIALAPLGAVAMLALAARAPLTPAVSASVAVVEPPAPALGEGEGSPASESHLP
jgi:UDP-GlcNAc:undecaprenyl-phosphate GlcNAc-1-phosphate transferase